MKYAKRLLQASLPALSMILLLSGCQTSQAKDITVAARPAAPLQVKLMSPATGVVARQRSEFSLEISGGSAPYRNPYDPEQVMVDLLAVKSGRPALRIPAFWSGAASPAWHARVALPEAGKWELTAIAKDGSGETRSAALTVSVAPATASGFIRRAVGAGKRRYFQYEDGKPYFLVGENVCWADGSRGIADYEMYFSSLGKVGANYARVWMQPKAIESKESGLGRYDETNAAYFDRVLEIAEANGIGVMLAFGTYGEFNTGGYFNEGRWPVNPYNAANGGPIPTDKPDLFFTDPEARKRYRQRLRYLVARYGAFRSLAFWEFWNEKAGPREWFVEMSRYLTEIDPYHHLVTNSYSTTGPAEVWEIPEIALTQTHRYGDEGSLPDIANDIPGDNRAHDRYQKPHLLGEYGISWRGPDAKFDPEGTGVNLHNGLWASAMSGAAGGGAIWWWDNYVHPKNLYPTFIGLAKFARTVDWPNRDFEPITEHGTVIIAKKDSGPIRLREAVLSPNGEWGVKATGTLRVLPDGTVAGGPLPRFLYGPGKAEFSAPVLLRLKMLHAGKVTLRVARVSDKANLRITVGDRPPLNLPFDASEKGPGGYTSTRFYPEYGIYQADFDKDIPLSLPAGETVLKLENTAGDWLTLASITVPEMVPSNLAGVRSFGLQDSRGETLLWLQDPDSNWLKARDKSVVLPQSGLTVDVPLPSTAKGECLAQWWDTRTGEVLQTVRQRPVKGRLKLVVPTFTRDIALHVTVGK